jgi:flagellar protein FlaI
LDYQTVFRWDAPADEFESRLGGSAVVAEIRDELGWSEARMERELRDRRRVLAYASQQGYTDYQAFTDLVNEYYSDKQRVMARVEDSAIGEPAVEQP